MLPLKKIQLIKCLVYKFESIQFKEYKLKWQDKNYPIGQKITKGK